ncbi:MAG TPA: TonB-dependent receptor [Gammaproteobacteria bacterium]|nr:TonB-dependent receptor [Gammaproteobacteria bacterium]
MARNTDGRKPTQKRLHGGGRWHAGGVLFYLLPVLTPDCAWTDSRGQEGAMEGLPTIVISPEWREADPLSVPKTVNRLGSQRLDGSGTGSTVDLQYAAPGFVFKTNSVLGQPYLRGVGSDVITAGAEASVATFIDGVYQPRAFDSIVDFYDIDRVELIKGPQSVSLGRNVVGGAVSIHTRDPVFYPDSWGEVVTGTYNRRGVRGALNLPAPEAGLALRIAGNAMRRDGYSRNLFLGEDADNENSQAVRGKLLYRPHARLRLLFAADYREEASNRAIAPWVDPEQGVNGGILSGGTVPEDPRRITSNVRPDLNLESVRLSLHANGKGERQEWASTTAYLDTDVQLALDLDGTDADFAANFPFGKSRAFIQEFRLYRGGGEQPGWTLGAFFLRENARQALDIHLPLSGIESHPDGRVDTLSWSVFVQFERRLKPRWWLRGGLRHSRDRRRLDLRRTRIAASAAEVEQQHEQSDWQATIPELSLSYVPSTDRLYYASVSRGYKAGGYNTSSIQPAFDPEYLWAWELGFKSRRHATRPGLRAALFYYDYRDMQLRTPPPDASEGSFPRVINAAESVIQGLDLEADYRPLPGLSLSLGTTLLDARFEEFVSVDPNNPDRDPDRSGDPLPQAPALSLNLGLDYRWRTARGGGFALRMGYRYQSAVYFNIYKDRSVREKAYGILDAGLEYQSPGRRWYARLHGGNLTNELYAQTIIRNDPLIGVKRFWGAPRTWTLSLGYRL